MLVMLPLFLVIVYVANVKLNELEKLVCRSPNTTKEGARCHVDEFMASFELNSI